MTAATDSTIEQLILGDLYDPHAVLGHHDGVIRLFRPGASEAYVEINGASHLCDLVHPKGVFELKFTGASTDYQVYHQDGSKGCDPYVFPPYVGQLDLHLFSRGVHYELYRVFGANVVTRDGVEGVAFAVWAPSAKRVSLVGDFNHWDGRVTPMRSLGSSGVWELFVPGLTEGSLYKYEIKTARGEILLKADPMAKAAQLRPNTASRVTTTEYEWTDDQWVLSRTMDGPINVYEVHLGSWKPGLQYRELAEQLSSYCIDMGYTHVELMPVMEHPLDESWGYQVGGYYAVTSRYGSPQDFQFLVNHLHNAGIGVILDWVPGHFPTDQFGLARFDGTALYEHEDPRLGFHPHWNTHIFNYGRFEVSNFLIANALYWIEEMHIDGLRVDAVASMLYLDYGREEGEWIANKYGGRNNLDAIEFLKHLNSAVKSRNAGCMMIAEESTSFPGISHSLESGGIGFDIKWNMGWMNDTLRYFERDPIYRKHHQGELTFGLIYAFSERFMLPFSHDEVVHGKKSMLSKMPGDRWQQFANLRLLYSYMMCQPGKKLLFMAAEFGQWTEWNCKQPIDWPLLDNADHKALHECVRALNHFYKTQKPLWEKDFDHTCFEWVDFKDTDNCVLAYKRNGADRTLICVHNFTPTYHPEYRLYSSNLKSVREVFNTDASEFGGSGKVGAPIQLIEGDFDQAVGFTFALPPLATIVFEIE